MKTKTDSVPAPAPAKERKQPVVVDVRGTSKLGDILTHFGKIKEGKSVITLRVELFSSCREDTIPSERVNAALLAKEATLIEKAALATVAALTARVKAKLASKPRGKRDVWTTVGTIKRG